MNAQKSTADFILPIGNDIARANKGEAAFCVPPFCNGVSNNGQRPRIELTLADPFKVLAIA